MAGRTGEELCSAATAAGRGNVCISAQQYRRLLSKLSLSSSDAGYLANLVDAFCHNSLENSRSNSTEVTQAEGQELARTAVTAVLPQPLQ